MKKYTVQCQVCNRVSKSSKPLTEKGEEALAINEYLYQVCDTGDCRANASEHSIKHDEMMYKQP